MYQYKENAFVCLNLVYHQFKQLNINTKNNILNDEMNNFDVIIEKVGLLLYGTLSRD